MSRHLYFIVDAGLSQHLVWYLFIFYIVVELDRVKKWLTIFYSDVTIGRKAKEPSELRSGSVIIVYFSFAVIGTTEKIRRTDKLCTKLRIGKFD